MNPIYKFYLSAGGTGRDAFPIYKDDLAIDYSLESNQQFMRGSLSGKLTFEGDDYTFIVSRAFDTQFGLAIYISYDSGTTWALYWEGQFWKTDCEFNADDRTVIVTPTLKDRYTDVLAGLDKEFDLIKLAPAIQPVKIDKRPLIQIYVPGQSVIGCFLSGMWWEQECEAISDENLLITHHYFALNKGFQSVEITGTMAPQLPAQMSGELPANYTMPFEIAGGGYKISYSYQTVGVWFEQTWQIIRESDNTALWRYVFTTQYPHSQPPYTVNLQPVTGSGATGTVQLSFSTEAKVYARYLCDVESGAGVTTYELPDDDLVPDNRNYSRVVPYYFPDTIDFSTALSSSPTQWGLYQPGQYYQMPYNPLIRQFYPVARAQWSFFSIWFAFSAIDWLSERSFRKEYTLKDAYPLWSVISVLLGQIAPGLTHGNTTDYSQFLYAANNPITGARQTLFVTPKSNIISSGYDQPAQKAPVTLGDVLAMLRDCFRCYWFVDDSGRFRIEHIRYFLNGGSYSDTPGIGIDLELEQLTRNGKRLSFATNQYKFDKPEMAARYQFGWMDDVTTEFEGFPIDILSQYVTPGNIENVQVSKFTSDVDYILLNPGDISKDGFVLLAASLVDGEYKLQYYTYNYNDTDHILQNGLVSFAYLQNYYIWDMPARNYEINGVQYAAYGVKKLKTQSVKFPILAEPNFLNLIKTGLGNGTIQKLSVNLSSRNANATLKYDTE